MLKIRRKIPSHRILELLSAKLLLMLCFFAALGLFLALTAPKNTVFADTNNTNNNDQDPDSINLRILDAEAATEIDQLDFNIARLDNGNLATKRTVAEVNTSNVTGYKLYLQSDYQSDGNYTTNLVNTDSSITDVIPTSTTASSLFWNYRNPFTDTLSVIPEYGRPDKIAQNLSAATNDQIPVDVNVSVDTTIATGEYENRLLFTAISNPTTVTYTITINTEGGVPEIPPIEATAAAGSFTFRLPATVPVKSGRVFKYWLDPDTGNTYLPNETVTIYSDEEFTGDVNLAAVYNHTPTLIVDPNGGTWGDSQNIQRFVQEEGTTKPIDPPSKGASYTISYNNNGQGASYDGVPTSIERQFDSWSLMGEGNYENGIYTYGAEDGTLTAQYNSTSNTFVLPAISKVGHTCKWAEGSTSGSQFDGGTERTITGNTTYYAVCVANKYSLTINPNGGSWENNPAPQEFIQDYGSTKNIANAVGPAYNISYDGNGQGATYTDAPTSVGRAFSSWTLSGSGNLSGDTFTFGDGNSTLTAQYSNVSSGFTLPVISKTDYVCTWNEGSASGKAHRSGEAGVTIAADTTFVAVCTTSYTLTVDPNGGTWNGSSSPQDFVQDSGTTKSIPNPSATPTYSISYNANGQGASYTASPTTASRPFTGWSHSGYGSLENGVYTFRNGDGSLTAQYDSTSSSFTLPSISKTGYSCYWAEGSASGQQYSGGTNRTITGNTTYYAVCSINSYALTVNPNGGTWNGSSSTQYFYQNYGTSKSIPNPTSTPSYSIYYNGNSQGATYTASPTSVSRSFSSWSLSGSGSFASGIYTFGAGSGTLKATYNSSSRTFTLPAISKSGSTCKWAKGSASGTQYSGGSSLTISSSTTFYAVCTASRSSLTINPNGGTYGGSTSSTTVYGYEGDTYTLSTPTGPKYSLIFRDLYNSYKVDHTLYTNARAFSSWSKSGGGSLSGNTYTFGAGTSATVTASYASTATYRIPTTHSAYVCDKTFYWKASIGGTIYSLGSTITIYGNDFYYYEVCQ